ncbi:MAG TPA: hypothetical protein PLV51_00795 [Lentimicrobium sp.]|jgi:hypothetical protein|nr:hypothetical protein [Lentimicrobium sp.]
MKPEITRYLPVEELISSYPYAIRFLSDRGLQCIICGEPVWGTIEELALDKNYGEEEIDKLIEDLKREAYTDN